MSCTIYMITHKGTGRGYVGFTRGSLRKRWTRHLIDAADGRPGELYERLRDEGEESFHVRAVADGIPYPDVLVREREEVAKRKTYAPHGFNGAGGAIGVAVRKHREKDEKNGG